MKDEIKIVHTADTHIGYRQYHSEQRRQDFLNAFEQVIDGAIELKANAVVHAGDLFDSRTPGLIDVMSTMRILKKLSNHGIPFLSIVGNHESKQQVQWLDIFENSGIATRLGFKPYKLSDEIAIYGIDSVPRSRIPHFDYSEFEEDPDSKYNLMVMHQLMKPLVIGGDWECYDVINNVPFDIDGMLLGDYHIYDKRKINGVWVTYPGSTERTSTEEKKTRSYNIITLNDSGIEISSRNLETRKFVFIDAEINSDDNALETIKNKIKEYDITNKVAVLNVKGDSDETIRVADIEEFMISKNALVPRINDKRHINQYGDSESIEVSFTDPDVAVKEKIKEKNLSEGGLVIDETVRNFDIAKTNVESYTRQSIEDLVENTEFPDKSKKESATENTQLTQDQYGQPSESQPNIDDNNTNVKRYTLDKGGQA